MLYQLHRMIAWFMVITTPVRLIASLPLALSTQAYAQTQTANVPYNLTLDTKSAQAITVQAKPKPDFDVEVIAPLKAAQAAKAQAEAAAALAARAVAVKAAAHVVAPAGDDAFAQIRYCEAGGDYTRNSGNGYFGAYQYALGSWGNYGGYARPDLAPASVQDEKAHLDQARRGWAPWPACARRLGLL